MQQLAAYASSVKRSSGQTAFCLYVGVVQSQWVPNLGPLRSVSPWPFCFLLSPIQTTRTSFACNPRNFLRQIYRESSMAEEVNAMASSIGSSLIPIINKLQDIFTASSVDLSKISLPHVAVVGCQSSGKSSVLEALVGRDFLPRGTDICTRRPLMLMLQNRPPRGDSDDAREWGEFRHLPGKRFYDFSKIRQEIQVDFLFLFFKVF